MQTTFSIGDLAKEFGVTLRTLRFYEDKNLIHPRRDGVNRLYGRRDRNRLELVLLGKRVGFSLSEIKEMLDLSDLGEGRAETLEAALARFTEKIEVLRRQKQDVKRAIAELTRTASIISGMLRAREATQSGETLQAAE